MKMKMNVMQACSSYSKYVKTLVVANKCQQLLMMMSITQNNVLGLHLKPKGPNRKWQHSNPTPQKVTPNNQALVPGTKKQCKSHREGNDAKIKTTTTTPQSVCGMAASSNAKVKGKRKK